MILLFLPLVAVCRIYNLQLSEFSYIAKFIVDSGYGQMHARAKLGQKGDDPIEFEILIFKSEKWIMSEDEHYCENKRRLAKAKKVIEATSSSEWSDIVISSLDQKGSPQLWYFALSKCGLQDKQKNYVELELEILNFNKSRLGHDERNLSILYSIHSIVTGLLFIINSLINRIKKFNNTYLILANFLDFLYASLLLWNLLTFSQDGEESALVNFLAYAAGYISHFILQCIFIVRASDPEDKELHEFHILMIFFFTVLHFIIVLISKIQRNNPYVMHELQGASGILLVIFKIILLIWFVKRDNPNPIQILHFIGIPLAIILCNFINFYDNQQLITSVTMILQLFSFFGFMISMLLKDKS